MPRCNASTYPKALRDPRCVSDDSEEELTVAVQNCHVVSSAGCEIWVRGPFHRSGNFVYGVKKLEVLDQCLGGSKKRTEREILMSWDCPCS